MLNEFVNPPHIVLIGMPGSGKSTVGEILAQKLSWRFTDLDFAISEQAGKTIPKIFATEGEEGFRQREHQTLLDISSNLGKKNFNFILATGGGIILKAANRRLLTRLGYLVYLKAPIVTLKKHLNLDPERPLLAGLDPESKLNKIKLLEQARSHLYEDCQPALTIWIDHQDPHSISEEILASFERINK